MSRQFIVAGDNLSNVWATAFLEAIQPGKHDMVPLVVTITGLEDGEDSSENATIRTALDDALLRLGTKLSVGTVANTIFPQSLWNPCADRQQLYTRFEQIWPKVLKCPANHRGHYFRRLTQFNNSQRVNQLEHIITTYLGNDIRKGNHRRSALQAALFDPAHDHTHSQVQGFPCLQQVAFTWLDNGEMCVTGFYGLQYLFERAYGNYLGLCRLGRFMAHEMGLKLTRMTCVASAAMLADRKFRKGDLTAMASAVKDALPDGVAVGQGGVGCSEGSPVQAMWTA